MGPLQGAGQDYYVDKTGHDGNDGRAWGTDGALLTIQAGLTKCTTEGDRVFVGPGAYAETLLTPLDGVADYGSLIGVNPIGRGYAVSITAADTADEVPITVRGRGWRISNLFITPSTNTAGVQLDSTTDGCVASYAQIDHCHFSGGWQGVNAIGGGNFVVIRDNMFRFILGEGGSGAGQATAITNTTGNCMIWTVENNIFVANNNHICQVGSYGCMSFTIKGNTFHKTYVGGSSVYCIYLGAGGGSNVITQNFLGGDYTRAGGYLSNSANDNWYGNYANVDDGITQDNPA